MFFSLFRFIDEFFFVCYYIILGENVVQEKWLKGATPQSFALFRCVKEKKLHKRKR
jgi:hypothetical protein